MIIVDTNIVAYLYLSCEFTSYSERLLLEFSDWAAPFLWRSEFRNILAGYIRRRQITCKQALQIQREAEMLLAGFEFEVNSKEVLNLVNESNCSAYDCEFVALAKEQNTFLFTMDKKIIQSFPDIAKFLVS